MEKNSHSASEAVLDISGSTFFSHIGKMNFPAKRKGSKSVIPEEPLIEFLMHCGELLETPPELF